MYVDLDTRLSVSVDDFEGKVLYVVLDLSIVEAPAHETLDVEDGSLRVCRVLVLCRVTYQAFFVRECYPTWGDTVPWICVSIVRLELHRVIVKPQTLIIGYDVHTAIFHTAL